EFVRRDGKESASLPGRAELTLAEEELLKQYNELADQVTAIGVELGQLRAKKQRTAEEEQRLAKLEDDRVIINRYFSTFLNRLKEELAEQPHAAGRVSNFEEWQNIASVLKEVEPGAVALYTLVTEKKYRIIVVTADSQKAAEYP